MKLIFSTLVVVLVSFFQVNGQNLLQNGSFENGQGDPRHFYQNQVTDWFGIGNQSDVYTYIYCQSDGQDQYYYPPQNGGSRMAVLEMNHAIGQNLYTKLIPFQTVDVTFKAKVPTPCGVDDNYTMEFWVSNVGTNSTNSFGYNVFDYKLVGSTSVSGNFWTTYTAELEIPESDNYDCKWGQLIAVLRPGSGLNGSNDLNNKALLFDNDYILVDEMSLTACMSTEPLSILYNIDNNGICTDVLFTANCQHEDGYHYLWNFGDGNCTVTNVPSVEHEYIEQGTYYVGLTVIDPDGCIKFVSEPVPVNCPRCQGIVSDFRINCLGCTPLVVIDPVTGKKKTVGYSCNIQLLGGGTPSNGATINSWKYTDNYGTVLSTQQNAIVTVSFAAPFFINYICLRIGDTNGCYESTCKVVYAPCHLPPGLKMPSDEDPTTTLSRANLYPNPISTDELTIQLPDELEGQEALVDIYDMNGKKMLSQQLLENSSTVNIAALPSGMYFVHLNAGEWKEIQKLVVQK